MHMPLDQWRAEVGKHLDMISAGASMTTRHAEQLPIRPGFETYAEDDLRLCEIALTDALLRVQLARAIYNSKEIGT
jgi:hypothetical protein